MGLALRPLLGQDERCGAVPTSAKETGGHFVRGIELANRRRLRGALPPDPQGSEAMPPDTSTHKQKRMWDRRQLVTSCIMTFQRCL